MKGDVLSIEAAGHPATANAPAPPSGLEALESDDGELVVLCFGLQEGAVANPTPAESDVAAHIPSGRSNSEIAAIRKSSPRTTANQIASLFYKLGVRSRLELVALAPFVNPVAGRR